MSNDIYKEDRRIGFLWEDEREFIDAHPLAESDNPAPTSEFDSLTEENAAQVAHRLKNRPASARGLGEILDAFRTDLLRIERFWDDAMIDEDGRFEFENIILPANEDHIADLHRLLGAWLQRAESDQLQDAQQRLNEKLAPLRQDLDSNADEYRARLTALTALIRDEPLRELFHWVESHPGNKVRAREYQDTTWRWAASRTLQSSHELIENDGPWDHCYRLSTRGEAVYEAIQNLTEAEEVDGDSVSERLKTWLRFIERYQIE